MGALHNLAVYKETKIPIMHIYSGAMLNQEQIPKYPLVTIKLEFKGDESKSLARFCFGRALVTGLARWFRIINFYPGLGVVLYGTIGQNNADIVFADPYFLKGTITGITQLDIGYKVL